jgi:ribonuclease PH
LCYLCHSKVHPHLRNLNQMRKVASRHSVQPKINGPLVTTQGINNIIVAVKGA